jgi:nicotinate-nucleotide adenylyltransferase
MRLGIFGGTFDPVHYGHLLLAEQCREQCNLDAVWFVPALSPPHKSGRVITPAESRATMLELALAGQRQFSVNRVEFQRQGPSYTVETLRTLFDEDRSRELFFLVGADSLAELPTWREPHRILELATLVAVNRRGVPSPDREEVNRILAGAAARVQVVEIPGVDYSSSDLRHRVRTGRSIRYMTPERVEQYIASQRLYQSPT